MLKILPLLNLMIILLKLKYQYKIADDARVAATESKASKYSNYKYKVTVNARDATTDNLKPKNF